MRLLVAEAFGSRCPALSSPGPKSPLHVPPTQAQSSPRPPQVGPGSACHPADVFGHTLPHRWCCTPTVVIEGPVPLPQGPPPAQPFSPLQLQKPARTPWGPLTPGGNSSVPCPPGDLSCPPSALLLAEHPRWHEHAPTRKSALGVWGTLASWSPSPALFLPTSANHARHSSADRLLAQAPDLGGPVPTPSTPRLPCERRELPRRASPGSGLGSVPTPPLPTLPTVTNFQVETLRHVHFLLSVEASHSLSMKWKVHRTHGLLGSGLHACPPQRAHLSPAPPPSWGTTPTWPPIYTPSSAGPTTACPRWPHRHTRSNHAQPYPVSPLRPESSTVATTHQTRGLFPA